MSWKKPRERNDSQIFKEQSNTWQIAIFEGIFHDHIFLGSQSPLHISNPTFLDVHFNTMLWIDWSAGRGLPKIHAKRANAICRKEHFHPQAFSRVKWKCF